jgi:GNAT superfamily N-acetyltransferase
LVTRNALLVAPVQAGDVEDLTDLTDLWSSARLEAGSSRFEPGGPGGPGKNMHKVVSDVLQRHGVHAFLARHDGHPVGYVIATSGPLLPLVDTPALCIEHLFVQPEARHKGAGTALISACATLAERVGAEQVAVGVPSMDREPNRFFARLGFSPFVVRRVVGVKALRRRLGGCDNARQGLEQTLLRRRSLRARDRARALVTTPSISR